MIKLILLFILIIFSGCVGRRGISAKYYNDCKEYYDVQGYYHKKCDDSDMITYKEIKDKSTKIINKIEGKKPKHKVQRNVW